MIKFLGTAPGNKGKVLLNFVCGDRVLQQMSFALTHQAKLTSILKGGPIDHASKAELVTKSLKTAERALKTSLQELAKIDAERYKTLEEKPDVFVLHKTHAGFDYINTLSKVMTEGQSAFMTVGDERDKSCMFQFIVHSPKLESLQDEILALIGGKGSAKNGRMQGKCSNCTKQRKQVVALLSA